MGLRAEGFIFPSFSVCKGGERELRAGMFISVSVSIWVKGWGRRL